MASHVYNSIYRYKCAGCPDSKLKDAFSKSQYKKGKKKLCKTCQADGKTAENKEKVPVASSPATDIIRVSCSFVAAGIALTLLTGHCSMAHANNLALSIALWHLLELLFFPVERDPFAMQVHHVVVITTETLGWYFLTEPVQLAIMSAAALPLITNCFSVARFYFHPVFHEIYYHAFTATKLICISVHYGLLIVTTRWRETMGSGEWLVLGTMFLIHLTQLYFVWIITRKRMGVLSVAFHLLLAAFLAPYLWTWLVKTHDL